MSSIDERIVEMQFDNKQFESGVQTTLNSLDKLDEGLKLEGAKEGLKNISDMAGRMNLDSIADGVDSIAERFSILGIMGKRVIEDLTDSLYNMSVNFAKSLTIDQISEGWNKYEGGIRNTLTLMNQGEATLEEAEHYMDKLSWYADVTSFDMNAMSSALGAFVTYGVPIEEAIPAIMGIGNSITYAGRSAKEGTEAFSVYATAMAGSYMQMRQFDQLTKTHKVWTNQMSKSAMDTAVSLGLLTKVGDDAYVTTSKAAKKGVEVSSSTVRETLRYGWLTKEVLKQVLSTMGGSYADALAEATLAEQEQRNVVMSLDESMNELGVETDDFSKKCLESATLCRTYADAIDAVKDAVSTLYSGMMKNIFGNVDQATELWTAFQNVLLDVVTGPLSRLSEILASWNKLGGRTILIETIKQIWKTVTAYLTPIGKAFDKVFGRKEAKDKAMGLIELTTKVYEFFKKLEPGENLINGIKSAFTGLFRVIHLVITAFGFAVEALTPLWKIISRIGRGIGAFLAAIGKGISLLGEFWENLYQSGYFTNPFIKLKTKLSSFNTEWEYLLKMWETAKGLLNVTNNSLQGILGSVKLVGKGIINLLIAPFVELGKSIGINFAPAKTVLLDFVTIVTTKVGKAFEYLKTVFHNTFGQDATFFSILGNIFSTIVHNISENYKKLKELVPKWWGVITSFFDKKKDKEVETAGHRFPGVFRKISYFVNGLTSIIKKFFGGLTIKDIMDDINSLLTGGVLLKLIEFIKKTGQVADTVNSVLKTFFSDLGKTMSAFQKSIKAKALKDIAIAIAILAGSVIALTFVDANKLGSAVAAVTSLMLAFRVLMGGFNKLTSDSKLGFSDFAKGFNLVAVAGAISLLSLVVYEFAKLGESIGTEKLYSAIFMVGLIGAAFVVLLNALDNTKKMDLGITKGTGTEMIKLALSLYVMAKAFEQFATLDETSMQRGIYMFSIMGAFIAGMSFITGKWKGDATSASTAFFKMGATFTAMAYAFKMLGEVENFDQVTKALVGITLAFTLLIGIVAIAGNLGKQQLDFTSIGTAFLLLGIALIPIAHVMEYLGRFSSQQMESAKQGLIEIGLFMSIMMGVLVLAAAAMNKMEVFTNKSNKTEGGGGIFGVLFGNKSKSSDFTKKGTGIMDMATAFLTLSVSLVAIAGAFRILGSLSLEQLGIAFLGVVGALAALVGAAALMKGLGLIDAITALGNAFLKMGISLVAAGAGMALISLAIVPFAASILAAAPLIVLAIVAIINMFGTVIDAICNVLITGAPKLVQTLWVLLNAVFAVLNLAIPILTGFLGLLVIAILEKLTEILPPLVEAIFNLIIVFVNSLADTIRTKKSELAGALLNVLEAIFELLWELLTQIITGIVGVFSQSLAGRIEDEMNASLESLKNGNVIENALGVGEAVGENTTEGATDAIEASKEDIFNAAYGIPSAATDGVEAGLEDEQTTITEAIQNFLVEDPLRASMFEASKPDNGFFGLGGLMTANVTEGLSDPAGMTALLGTGESNITDLLGAMTNTVNNGGEDGEGVEGIGKNVLSGLNVGMLNPGLTGTLKSTAFGIGKSLVDNVAKGAGVNSPSIYSIITGEYIDAGLIVGLGNKEGDVEDAAAEVSEKAILSLKAPLQLIQNILDEELEIDPTITPVLDLSKVDDGLETLNNKYRDTGILNAAEAYWRGLSYSEKITHLASEHASENTKDDAHHYGITKVINYTQINQSPKNIDASEADRLNRSQFARIVDDPDTVPDKYDDAERIKILNEQARSAYI